MSKLDVFYICAGIASIISLFWVLFWRKRTSVKQSQSQYLEGKGFQRQDQSQDIEG